MGSGRKSTRRGAAGLVIAALLVAAATTACRKRLKFDAERIRKKCQVTRGVDLSADQARCVARLAGLRDGRKCSLEVSEVAGDGGEAAYRVRESCAEVGLVISRRDGRVIGMELGEAVVPVRSTSPDEP